MNDVKIYKPRCRDCEFHLCYSESVPKKVKGAFLEKGYRYCTAGKQTRQFGKRDPKMYVPSWCPIKKTPAELRVYCYKDENSEWMRLLLHAQGIQEHPSGYQYAVCYTGHTALSASEFLELTQQKLLHEILGFHVHIGEIIEIDDGIKPYYFQLIELTVIKTIRFIGERVR